MSVLSSGIRKAAGSMKDLVRNVSASKVVQRAGGKAALARSSSKRKSGR